MQVAAAPKNWSPDLTSLFSPRVLAGLLQLGGVALVLALLFVFARAPEPDLGSAIPADPGSAAQVVRVIRPQAASNAISVSTTGTVVARNYVALAPEASGRVVWVADALRSGEFFKADQELLRIDPQDYQLSLDQSLADLEAAKAALVLREAESEVSIQNFELLHPGEPVPLLVARLPQIEQAKAQIAIAEARVDSARINLGRTRFSLPFDGYVTESQAELGQVLSRNQPFGRVFALESVEVLVSVSSDELALLQPVRGRVATVRSRGFEVQAEITRTSPELDRLTRMASLALKLSGGQFLPPGTFVDVDTQGPALEQTFLLPEATQRPQGKIWIARDGVIEEVDPQVLGRASAGTVVRAFDVGDGIIVGTVGGLGEGASVRPVEVSR